MDPGASASFGSAFAEVYRQHHTFVWRTLRCMSVVDSALDDATQDVFLVVHRRLPEFEGRAAVRTWLFEIVRRVASRYRSSATRDAGRTFEMPELASATDLDEAVAHAMAREVLRAFLDELDEDRLRVFVLAEVWQLKGREIAAELGVNQNTVYARLRSARDELDRLTTRLRAREAGNAITAMRRARPTRAARKRTWRALVVGLGLPGAPLPVVAATSWTAGLGWGLVGVLAGAAVIVGLAVAQPERERSSPPPDVVEPAIASAPTLADDTRAPAIAPTDPVPVASAFVAQEPADAQLATQGSSSSSERAAPARRSASTTEAAQQAALAAEVRLVREIREAVASATVGASDRIARYRAEYPAGALRPEVEALAIELTCRTSPSDGARALDGYARRFPRSTLLPRLQTICGAEENGPQKPRARQTQPL